MLSIDSNLPMNYIKRQYIFRSANKLEQYIILILLNR